MQLLKTFENIEITTDARPRFIGRDGLIAIFWKVGWMVQNRGGNLHHHYITAPVRSENVGIAEPLNPEQTTALTLPILYRLN